MHFARMLAPLLFAAGCAGPRVQLALAQLEDMESVALAPHEGSGPGLSFACHAAPILWLSLRVDESEWIMTSVDAEGFVGEWRERGLERSWALTEAELETLRSTQARFDEAEAEDEDAGARVPRLLDTCEHPKCRSKRALDDITPVTAKHWIGAPSLGRVAWRDSTGLSRDRRIAGADGWFVAGDAKGNLVVGLLARSGRQRSWRAPGCEKVWAMTFAGGGDDRAAGPELILYGFPGGRTLVRLVDLERGTQSILRAHESDGANDLLGTPILDAAARRLLIPVHHWGGFEAWSELARFELGDGAPVELDALPSIERVEAGSEWVVVNRGDDDALVHVDELWTERPELDYVDADMAISADDRWLGRFVGTRREIHDRRDQTSTTMVGSPTVVESRVAIARDGTLAVSLGERVPVVEVFGSDGSLVRHELSSGVADMGFVAPRAGAPDMLWMLLWSGELWTLVGAEPQRHLSAGEGRINLFVGRGPGPTATLVLDDGRGPVIERLDDGSILRLAIHDPDAMFVSAGGWTPSTTDSLALSWTDAEGELQCRHDQSDARPGPRTSDAASLLDAFFAGRSCPVGEP